MPALPSTRVDAGLRNMGTTERNRAPSGPEAGPGPAGSGRKLFRTAEGWILAAGLLLACAHMVVLGLAYRRSPALAHSLMSMTGTHILGGRGAAMSWGYVQGLPVWAVIVVNMVIETFLVFLAYPLFVFSYRGLLKAGPLEDALGRARRAAQAHQQTIMKFGIPGLLLFVWFPFWMTGPIVGSVIGFLIGLRPWVNMAVVLSGTYLAIVCWSLLLKQVHESLQRLGPYVPVAFASLIVLAAVGIHVGYALSRRGHNGAARNDGPGAPPGQSGSS